MEAPPIHATTFRGENIVILSGEKAISLTYPLRRIDLRRFITISVGFPKTLGVLKQY